MTRLSSDMLVASQAVASACRYGADERWKWVTSALIGVVMGFVAFAIDALIDTLNAFKFGTVTGLIQSGTALPTWLAFVSVSCMLACVAGSLVSFIEPLAAGSGIPELKAYLNGVHLPGLLRLRTLLAKLGGISFSIGAGGAAHVESRLPIACNRPVSTLGPIK
jgi:chloride channel 7